MTRKYLHLLFLSAILLCVAYTPAYSETLYYDDRVYEGEVANGKPHGKGTMEFTNGYEYVGEWFLGTRKGQGTLTWPDGQKYVGEWLNDERHGQGTLTMPDGRKYVGEWMNGERNGQGTHTWPDGGKYVGEWMNGEYNGQGTYTWPDGGKYVGEWMRERNGQGTYTWPNGDIYIGEWMNGEYNGQGRITLADGAEWFGEWLNGEYNGSGTHTWPNGDIYIGEWLNDKRHGQGTYYFADGRKEEIYYNLGERVPKPSLSISAAEKKTGKKERITGTEPRINGSPVTENNSFVWFALIFVFLALWYITSKKRRTGAQGAESIERPIEKPRAWTSLISILLMVVLPLGTLGSTSYNLITLPRENPSLLGLAGWNLYFNLEWIAMVIFSSISIYAGWSLRTQLDASATHRNILCIWGFCVAGPLTMDSVIPALALGLSLQERIFMPENLGHLLGLSIFAAFCQRYLSSSMNKASGQV